MNAAAKVINQSNLFNGHLFDVRISRRFWMLLFVLSAVLLTALAIIYTTNEYRVKFGQLQYLERQKMQLQFQWGQLLLEQASLSNPGRVQQMAVEQLQMRASLDKENLILQRQ